MTPDMQNGYIHEFESIRDPDDVVRKPIDTTEARELHAKIDKNSTRKAVT